MTSVNQSLKPIAAALLLGGLLVGASGFAYLFFTTKTYRASTKLKVEKHDWVHTNDLRSPYDPGLAPAECRVAASDAILDQAIQNLGLNERWAKSRLAPGRLSTAESRDLLRAMTDIHPVPQSSLIEVSITGADREETARVANALVGAYHDFRQAQRENASREQLRSLDRLWTEQSRKVQQAQAAVDRLAAESNQAQATNAATVFDPESLELLQTRRLELEADYKRRRNEYDQLKAMDHQQLVRVLPSMDTQTNPLLWTCFTRLSEAKNNLADAQTAHAPDSPEVKRAALVVNQLSQRFDEALDGAMSAREKDLAALGAALEALNHKLAHATTNLTGLNRPNVSYDQAVRDLGAAKGEQEALKERIAGKDSLAAMLPTVVSVEIMDPAEIPSHPIRPDRNLGLAVISAGGFGTLSGLALLWFPPKVRPGPDKRRFPPAPRVRPDS